jgi:hypothetical protein
MRKIDSTTYDCAFIDYAYNNLYYRLLIFTPNKYRQNSSVGG